MSLNIQFQTSFPKVENYHQCISCEKVFAFQSSLIKHMRIHTGERPYTCDFESCQQKFSQVSNLIRHKRIHSGNKPYECQVCSKSFTSSSNLKQHENVHAHTGKRKKFCCFMKNCQKSYLYICTLKKHTMNMHPEQYQALKSHYPKSNFYQVYKDVKVNQIFPFVDNEKHCAENEKVKEIKFVAKPFEKPAQEFQNYSHATEVQNSESLSSNASNIKAAKTSLNSEDDKNNIVDNIFINSQMAGKNSHQNNNVCPIGYPAIYTQPLLNYPSDLDNNNNSKLLIALRSIMGLYGVNNSMNAAADVNQNQNLNFSSYFPNMNCADNNHNIYADYLINGIPLMGINCNPLIQAMAAGYINYTGKWY